MRQSMAKVYPTPERYGTRCWDPWLVNVSSSSTSFIPCCLLMVSSSSTGPINLGWSLSWRQISTTNWIQLYKASIAKEDGLKLVKVDIMGPHCDVLILLRSGAVLFSKANVKGKG